MWMARPSSAYDQKASRKAMSELTAMFRLYSKAAETLIKEYGDRKPDLFQGETVTQFEYSHILDSLEWLDERLPIIAEALLPAGFTLRFSVVAHDYQAIFLLREEGQRLWAEREYSGDYAGDDELEPLPESAVLALMTLQERFQAVRSWCRLEELYSLLRAVAEAGAIIQAKLTLFLDKRAVQGRFLAGLEESARPKLLVYLFSKSLSKALGRVSLQILEQEYFLPAHRSVWLVFSLQGYLEGEYLSVYGQEAGDRLEGLLDGVLAEDALQANLKAINLRRLTGDWAEPPRWLAPEVFHLRSTPPGDEPALRELYVQTQSIRALLAALYLADQVEADEDCFRVSYRGLGSASFWLARADILAATERVDDLYPLYTYAFAGFSPDKVEIAQQFLSLMVENPAGLIQKAEEVREATQKTYQERVLVERVRDYFEARHKVQERLRAATEAASEGLIELSREVSGDVYKIAGAVGAAVVAALIQPQITRFAVLAAVTVMVLYLALVLFYHLPSLQRANQLSYQGHKTGIRSFGDVLSVSEVEAYLQDEQLDRAQALLEQALRRARFIYRGLFLAAVLIWVLAIWALLR